MTVILLLVVATAVACGLGVVVWMQHREARQRSAARVAALLWFVVAAWGLYAVATRLFRWQVAAWTSALFVTNTVS